jgi:hypothetical protein
MPTTPLDVIRIEEPCSQDWDRMTGDERVRFCAGCRKHVHNLSAMTRDEAERLVCEQAGELCVRYEPTPAGAVRTLDYARRLSRRTWMFWTVSGTLGAAASAAAQLLMRPGPPPPPAPTPIPVRAPMGRMPVMGKIGPRVTPATPIPLARPVPQTDPVPVCPQQPAVETSR